MSARSSPPAFAGRSLHDCRTISTAVRASEASDGPGLTGGLNGNLSLPQLVPSLRPGFLKGAPDDPLKGLVRQTAEDLHFGQTRSPGQELVNDSRHFRQRRAFPS